MNCGIANATQLHSLYHLSLFPAAFSGAKILLTWLQFREKPFSLRIGILLVHFPKALLCVISSSAVCPQCIFLSSPKFCSIVAVRFQCDHTQHYPVCFIFLTGSHSKFSHEGGFVKRPSSLHVASDLFPFFSSCHSSLLLSHSCLSPVS